VDKKQELIDALYCPDCKNSTDFIEVLVEEVSYKFSVQGGAIEGWHSSDQKTIVDGKGIFCEACGKKVAPHYQAIPDHFVDG
jgi:uncharacterized protein YbaR (Trm112 family)